MSTEIERKFLVKNNSYKTLATSKKLYKQGYLKATPECTIRVRIVGDEAFITIKGKKSGISRSEFEYAIPVDDANKMLQTMSKGFVVEKYRYIVPIEGSSLFWEVDEFLEDNEGLVIAEIELHTISEIFEKPDWLGEEVSHSNKYYNAYLSEHPYKDW